MPLTIKGKEGREGQPPASGERRGLSIRAMVLGRGFESRLQLKTRWKDGPLDDRKSNIENFFYKEGRLWFSKFPVLWWRHQYSVTSSILSDVISFQLIWIFLRTAKEERNRIDWKWWRGKTKVIFFPLKLCIFFQRKWEIDCVPKSLS